MSEWLARESWRLDSDAVTSSLAYDNKGGDAFVSNVLASRLQWMV
jgi:hypothetical protein